MQLGETGVAAARWVAALATAGALFGGAVLFASSAISAQFVGPDQSAKMAPRTAAVRGVPANPSREEAQQRLRHALVPIAPRPAMPVAPPASEAGAPELASWRVVVDGLNVRTGPSGQSARAGGLERGDLVQAVSEQGAWLRISSATGVNGWVYRDHLERAL